MKYSLILSAVILVVGFLLKDSMLTITLYDTTRTISYFTICIVLVVVLNIILLIYWLLEKSNIL